MISQFNVDGSNPLHQRRYALKSVFVAGNTLLLPHLDRLKSDFTGTLVVLFQLKDEFSIHRKFAQDADCPAPLRYLTKGLGPELIVNGGNELLAVGGEKQPGAVQHLLFRNNVFRLSLPHYRLSLEPPFEAVFPVLPTVSALCGSR